MSQTILTTTRLVLRHFEKSDLQPLCTLFSDVEVMRFSEGTKSSTQVRTWVDKRIQEYQHNDHRLLLAVTKISDGQLLGFCGLSQITDMSGIVETELGYRLLRQFWGLGYATEAASAVRDYGFGILTLKRLVSSIDPDNHGSIAVAGKIGMTYEKEIMMPGYTYPDHLYSMCRPD